MRPPASILVVQHDDRLPPGLLGEWAPDRDVALHVVRADRGELAAVDPSRHDAAVVLGADASAADLHVPWVRQELAWLAAAAPRLPLLGIAYGSQALAVALGGRTRRAATPWITWGVGVTGADAPIPAGAWLCWQHELVVPPPGATIRARGLRGTLAYTHGRHLGVQFHPEVLPWMVDWWLHPEHGRPGAPGPRAGVLRALTRERAAASATAGRTLFDLLLARAGRGPAPRPLTPTEPHV